MIILEIKKELRNRAVNCSQCKLTLPRGVTNILFNLMYKGFRIDIRFCNKCGRKIAMELKDLSTAILLDKEIS